MIGFVYFLFPNAIDKTIIKIGMSANTKGKRLNRYGPDSKVLRVVNCDRPEYVESKIVDSLKKNGFKIIKGKEFFTGDSDKMLQCFDECVEQHADDPIERDINVSRLVSLMSQILNDHAGNVPLTQAEIFDMIRSDIQAYVGDKVMDAIDYIRSISSHLVMNDLIVPHKKMIEYGIATSDRSSNFLERLERLGLVENKDWNCNLRKSKSTGRPSKVYTLTPYAFQCIIMHANIPWFRSYSLLMNHLNVMYITYIQTHLKTNILSSE